MLVNSMSVWPSVGFKAVGFAAALPGWAAGEEAGLPMVDVAGGGTATYKVCVITRYMQQILIFVRECDH